MNLNSKMWLDIINQALIMISSNTLQTVNDGSNNASITTAILPAVIEEVYSCMPLNDIAVFTELPQVAKQLGSPFLYSYKLPADCARVRNVYVNDNKWQLTRDYINTDSESCNILYIQTPSSPESMPFYARSLVALLLASRIAIPIAHDQSLSNSLYNQYSSQLSKAITLSQSTHSQENYKTPSNYKGIYNG